MIKSQNFYDNGTCTIRDDCLFYKKDQYSAEEIYFYAEHCLRGGEGCGMKKNHDLSERVRNNLERNWEDK